MKMASDSCYTVVFKIIPPLLHREAHYRVANIQSMFPVQLHGKHALNILHTPIHDMLQHPLHYWNIQFYSDFS